MWKFNEVARDEINLPKSMSATMNYKILFKMILIQILK